MEQSKVYSQKDLKKSTIVFVCFDLIQKEFDPPLVEDEF